MRINENGRVTPAVSSYFLIARAMSTATINPEREKVKVKSPHDRNNSMLVSLNLPLRATQKAGVNGRLIFVLGVSLVWHCPRGQRWWPKIQTQAPVPLADCLGANRPPCALRARWAWLPPIAKGRPMGRCNSGNLAGKGFTRNLFNHICTCCCVLCANTFCNILVTCF